MKTAQIGPDLRLEPHPHYSLGTASIYVFWSGGGLCLRGERFMLNEGTVHLGGELQKSLQILDQAVDISGYVNSNHV